MLLNTHAQRTDYMVRVILPFIQGRRFLDVGSGRCRLEQRLVQSGAPLEIVSTDLGYKPNRDGFRAAFALADGTSLPFASASVETAHLGFMLHHTHDPLLVLREVVRVTARRILIWEDTPEPGFERTLVQFGDSVLNRDFGRNPHQNRSHGEWLRVFHQMGLRVAHEERAWLLVFGVPMASSFFVLDVN